MKLFISYAHEQRPIAEEINASLAALGFDVFFDKTGLKTGRGYDGIIKTALEDSDILVFLISPESVSPGSYTMTELGIRQRKYSNPSGTVLPVMVKATLPKKVAPYLRAVTILYPQGNVAAEVSAAVQELSPTSSADAASGSSAHYIGTTEVLHRERIAAYRPLWELTRVLPKWPKAENVQYGDLHNLSEALRDWYFVGGGGLFLSRNAHSSYAAIQNALTAILTENPSGPIFAEHYDAVRELCSALRTCLAADIGARD